MTGTEILFIIVFGSMLIWQVFHKEEGCDY